MTKLKPKLHGKAASYLLNAYIDIKIEQALISYIKSGRFRTSIEEVEKRVNEIIKNTIEQNKKERLLVKAFTFKRVNGFANYWYSKLVYKIIGEKFPQEKDYYMEMKRLINNPIIQIVGVILYYPTLVGNYAKKNGITITLSKNEIRDQILEVQKINIKENKKNATLIENKEKSWRVNKLISWSKESEHPDVFIDSAIQTQIHAGNWDRIYSRLIR